MTECFDDMALESNLLRGVYAYGFENPSAIQKRAIKPMIEGNINLLNSHKQSTDSISMQVTMLLHKRSLKLERRSLSVSPFYRESTPASRLVRL